MSQKAASRKVHICEIKETDPAFSPLPPFASRFRRFVRKIQKLITLDPNFTRTKRYYRNRSSMMNEQKRHINSQYSYIMHPFSVFNRIREIIFLILWTYEIIAIPIKASFGTTYNKGKTYNLLENKYVVEVYLLVPLEIMSVILMFFSGYVEGKSRKIVTNQKVIVNKYFKTYFFIDLLTITPIIPSQNASKILFFVHVACVLRIGTILQYLKNFLLDLRVKEEVYTCVALGVLTVYILNLFTCSFILIPIILYYNEEWPENTWMGTAQINPMLPEATATVAYLECLLCIVCHFFGAGQGMYEVNDIPSETLILSVVMITGRLWTLYIIANLLRIFNVVTISESKYEEYLLQIEVFMRQMKLDKKLRNRLVQFYCYKYQNHFFNEAAIFGTLSTFLRQELALFSARSLIAKVEIFKYFPKASVAGIVENAKVSIFLPNDTIAKFGEPIQLVHLISSGTVACLTGQNIEVAHLEDGDEMGLIGALCPPTSLPKYEFYFVAIEPTEVYSISTKDLRTFMSDNADLVKYFERKVNERTNSYIKRELAIKFQAYDLLSELSSGRILEKPRYRTIHIES